MVRTFKHEPLQGTTAIRLLKVHGEKPGVTAISCDLVHADLSTKPSYLALSYTWGDETNQRYIRVNGRPYRVRQSLYAFLKYAQKHLPEQLLWIDGICIDQYSVKERNHQVGIMADIYRQAEKVIVWLWPVAPIAEYAFQFFLHKYELRFEGKDIAQPEIYLKLQESLSAVSKCPYWSRAWVAQELSLARMHVLLCGDYMVPSRELFLALEVIAMDRGYRPTFFRPPIVHPTMFRYINTLMENQHVELADPKYLEDFLTSEYECFDPRDRIYALLSVIAEGKGFEIKYDEPTVVLALRAFSHFLDWDIRGLKLIMDNLGVSLNEIWNYAKDSIRHKFPEMMLVSPLPPGSVTLEYLESLPSGKDHYKCEHCDSCLYEALKGRSDTNTPHQVVCLSPLGTNTHLFLESTLNTFKASHIAFLWPCSTSATYIKHIDNCPIICYRPDGRSTSNITIPPDLTVVLLHQALAAENKTRSQNPTSTKLIRESTNSSLQRWKSAKFSIEWLPRATQPDRAYRSDRHEDVRDRRNRLSKFLSKDEHQGLAELSARI